MMPASLMLLLGIFVGFFCPETREACIPGQCQLLDLCSLDSDCAPGLYCSPCIITGIGKRCSRSQPTNVLSVNKNLPFNRYTWLTSHNSFSIVDEPSHTGEQRITFNNQEDNVTSQLNNGVRGLMLDMYDFNNDIWLCHSFGGKCYPYTAFGPALDTLREIEAFLSANPSEIVTIFIEDYVSFPNGLTNVFTAAGLMKYWFPVIDMPKSGGDWPLVNDMIAKNHRLIVFTSNPSKEQLEGIAYQWNYVIENQYGDDGMIAGNCSNRAESKLLNDISRSLVLFNFFRTVPTPMSSCLDNSNMLSDMLFGPCFLAAGNRFSNFVSVDFYKRSDGGGAFQAVDILNGQKLCGCNYILACQVGGTFGACPP